MTTQVDKITDIFRSVAQIPAITSAQIVKSKGAIIIFSDWSQRNLICNKAIKFTRTYFLENDLTVSAMASAEKSSELLSASSPSDLVRAVISQYETESKEKTKQLVQIWSNGQLQQCFDVTSLDVHGDIYTDTEFATLEWAPCEKKLLYIAEKKHSKSEPFFKVQPQNNEHEKISIVKGEEYLYKEEWGENLVGKVKSVIVTLTISQEAVERLSIIEQVPEYLCPAQARWAPDGSIVGVAWDARPRKLGLIYCSNRPSYMFRISINGEFSMLSRDNKAVRSPRFSPNGKWLVWIERNAGGPHLASHCLVKLAWPPVNENGSTTVIDTVKTHIMTANGKLFYGLFCLEFPKRCWLNNNILLFSTIKCNTIKSYMINIDTGVLLELSSDNDGAFNDGSLSILDVKDDIILSSWSSIQNPPQLLIGRLDACAESALIAWTPLSTSAAIPELENHFVEYLNLRHNTDEEINECAAIYYGNRNRSSSQYGALLVWPHGGPHSAFVNAFSSTTAFFALLGFSIVQVNYRGSIGRGQANIDFLLGRVGDCDVRDCKLATTTCIEKFSCSPKRCVLFGGSHGGFLVTHLSGQYPELYRAVVARNAVIDISTMVYTSDIPDWCAVELGADFTEVGPVNEQLLSKMRLASPLIHAHKVKAATLLMVGSKDLRVPPTQSFLYYNRLKANNNCIVKMHLYEDNHPLSKPLVEADCLINSALWLVQHSGIIL